MEPGKYRALVELTFRLWRSNGGDNDPTEIEWWTVDPGEEFEIAEMVNRHYSTVRPSHGDPPIREGVHYKTIKEDPCPSP